MLTIIETLIYCMIFGIGIGGMLLSNRNVVNHSQLFLFTISFGAIVYLGMVLGNYLFSFVTTRFVEVFIAIFLLFFLILSVLKYEHYLGYFHERSKELIWMIFLLFFMIGLEWVTLQLTYVMTLIGTVIFLCALLIGIAIQGKLLQIARYFQWIALVPMLWLLLTVMIRLFS